jgi:AmmeMemoRadiSam system protein B
MKIKPPAVAGTFYPLDPAELRHNIEGYLADNPCQHQPPKILVVPHAGYIYSGPIAARGYNTLNPVHDLIDRVLLIGPNHRSPLKGIAGLSADSFATPLGNIAIDRKTLNQLAEQQLIVEDDTVHRYEHCLEVQLPFLQSVLNDFLLIPLVVGQCPAEDVARLLRQCLDDRTLIVVSSDLSHYHPYQEACRIDQQTSDLIVQRHHHLNGEQACGCKALNGALLLAEQMDLKVERLDLRNSGDTAGNRSKVVGYGCFSIH